MTKKQSTLMLMVSGAAILTGVLFVFLPNRPGLTFGSSTARLGW